MKFFTILSSIVRAQIDEGLNFLHGMNIWDFYSGPHSSLPTLYVIIVPLLLMFMTSCAGAKKELPAVVGTSMQAVEIKTLTVAKEEIKQQAKQDTNNQTVRLMTYNIRHGVGVDNDYDLDRVIQVIKDINPDIVSLNEVDHMMPRSYMQRQDKIIAEALGYNFVYGYNINIGSKYGNVLLSKYPIVTYINHTLPKDKTLEPRGLIEADINIDGEMIKVLSTHLSIVGEERPEQVKYIQKKLEEFQEPTIIMGDFNASPTSDEIKNIGSVVKDSAKEEYKTFSANEPYARIDYIFVSEEIEVMSSKAIESDASDHFPVVAEIVLPNKNID